MGGAIFIPPPLPFLKLQIIQRAGVRIKLFGKKMKFKKTIMTLAIASAMQPVFAIENNNQDEIIVTATRTAQSVDETMAAVTVITRKEIENSLAANLQELLTGLAGIDMINAGGMGKDTSLYIRGTNKDHTVVLIDGIRVGSATTGEANIQHIPLDQIERIEIVRGTRAGYYGADAIGGVIQIFTRKGSDAFTAHTKINTGSSNYKNYSAGMGQKISNTRYQITASHIETDGIHAREVKNPDLDGYLNNSLSLGSQTKLSDSNELNITLLHNDGTNWYDGFTSTSDYYFDYQQQSVGINYKHIISDSWQTTFSSNQHTDLKDDYKDAVLTNSYLTVRQSNTWQNDIALADDNLLSIGLDAQYENIDSSGTSSYPVKYRTTNGVFISNQLQADWANINISLRHDQYSDFGNQTNGNIELGRKLTNNDRVFFNLASAFKAPTMNQLYSSSGNVGLNPEEVISAEFGYSIKSGKHKTDVSLYHMNYTNLIELDPVNIFQNINKAKISGIELVHKAKLGLWQLTNQVSLLSPINATNNNQLRRRSQYSFQLEAVRQIGSWKVGADITGQGSRFDDSDNTVLLESYELLNIKAHYTWSNKLQLDIKADNILETQYETRAGYNNPGTTYYLGLNYKM